MARVDKDCKKLTFTILNRLFPEIYELQDIPNTIHTMYHTSHRLFYMKLENLNISENADIFFIVSLKT